MSICQVEQISPYCLPSPCLWSRLGEEDNRRWRGGWWSSTRRSPPGRTVGAVPGRLFYHYSFLLEPKVLLDWDLDLQSMNNLDRKGSGGRSIIKIFWPIDLNNLWSQEICQPKMIVWSGATFILIWSCLILIYPISEGLPEQHLGDVRGQHRPKPRHAGAAAHSYRAQGGRVDFGCVLKEQKRELNMISKWHSQFSSTLPSTW